MTLPAGDRIGPYTIVAPIGAGGMGEVYRARDTRLDRDVAIKILPAAFAADAERLARFEREAKTLASLNHPNIAQIHGLEAAPGATGDIQPGRISALVMELVEGDDLSARIARGPVPIAEALEIARQLAGALETAHERGIIHRDLKPANIKVRADGTVKVLDFGLAKAMGAGGDFGSGGPSADLMNSPTITSPATQMGMIIGTAAYMAPEQAKGRAIDRRADVWAFGVVLFEMLTGKRVFEGGDITEVLASVIKDTPSQDALPADTPPAIRRLLRRCLEKNPARRLDSMGAARLEIEEALDPREQAPAVAAPRVQKGMRRLLPWAVAAAALAIAVLAGVNAWWRAPVDSSVTRLKFDTGFPGALHTPFGPAFAIAPDGQTLVASVQGDGGTLRLYVRRFDQLDATLLAGTEDATDPFFSPDGQWVGFRSGSRLKKIALTGGAPVDLADVEIPRGAAWGEDGMIYFTPVASVGGRLMRIPAGGGTPEPAGPMLDGHATQRWPQVLPGGKAIIYTGHTTVDTFEEASLVLQRLDGSAPRALLKGGYHWRYVSSGHIVYVHTGTLFAVPFDLDRLEITGTAVPVVERILASPVSGGAQLAIAANGDIAYARGELQALGTRLFWLDTAGTRSTLYDMKDNWTSLALSPDGTRLAIDRSQGQEQLEMWVIDLERDTETRLTINQVQDFNPVWTTDGRRVVFSSAQEGPPNLFWQPADGSAQAERLLKSNDVQLPWSWHPDGKRLLFSQGSNNYDLLVLTMPERTVAPFVASSALEGHGAFSPDGKWVAYASDESGETEVYVRPFPAGEGRWLISTGNGGWPMWSRTSNTLFYVTMRGELMTVRYEIDGAAFRAGRPQEVPNVRLLPRGASYSWALHKDGRRLATSLQDAAAPRTAVPDEVVMVLGFGRELKARVK